MLTDILVQECHVQKPPEGPRQVWRAVQQATCTWAADDKTAVPPSARGAAMTLHSYNLTVATLSPFQFRTGHEQYRLKAGDKGDPGVSFYHANFMVGLKEKISYFKRTGLWCPKL